MRRRAVVLAAVALLALGAAVAVWAARGDGSEPRSCTRTTFGAEDPTSGKVMTYHKTVCD